MRDDPDSIDDADRIQAAREEVIEAMANTAEAYGAKRSYGRLYGILYFADDPMSLDNLVDRSGYAKSTVSTAMTTLERFHMVQRRSLPGEGKRAFFDAQEEFWYVFQQFLETTVRREVETMSRSLAASAMLLKELETPASEDELDRVQQLEEVTDQCELLLDVLAEQSFEDLAAMADDE